MKHVKQSMRVVIVPASKPHDYQRLTLIVIAVLVAIIIMALFVPRSAHGETALQPVAYIPIAEANLLKYEATVLPISAMTATPPTATPQPELGEPPVAPVEVQ